MDIRTWLKNELKKTGKSQAELARHLRREDAWLSRILNGTRKLEYDYAVAIADFIGVNLPGSVVPTATVRSTALAGVPIKGVVMEQIWREGTAALGGRTSVAGVLDSEYPIEMQYALSVDDVDRPPGIASECVLCVPIAKIQRPIRKNDLIHCERTRSGLTQTVLRRVGAGNGKSMKVTRRNGKGTPELLADYEVKGLVIGRTQLFVV